MKRFALIGNPNSGKTTLFNTLTGSRARVGNWPGVTVDKKEGLYKKEEEDILIVDLPGIYSLSPYTSEEIISRNFILDAHPDLVINIVDATNIERNLYLTTQLLEIDVPVVIALNMSDILLKQRKEIDIKQLEKAIGVPVVSISALRGEGINELMHTAYLCSLKGRKATTVLENTQLKDIINTLANKIDELHVPASIFHAIKLIESDKIEVKAHESLLPLLDEFKANFTHEVFGHDFEAFIADARYNYITEQCVKTVVSKKEKEEVTISEKIDKVLTHRIFAIPIFIIILAVIFHLVFSEDLLFLHALGVINVTSFEGSMYEGLFANGGINSPGIILFNFFDCSFGALGELIANGLTNIGTSPWAVGLLCDGVLAGIFALLGFLPQILLLFLFFSILEDSGYMARIAFILDRIFRKFGLSGRAIIPMIMGFGCTVPANINTRTLSTEQEKIATLRVLPFFSCTAKLPILAAIGGGISVYFGFAFPDLITLSMYVLGMSVAIASIIAFHLWTKKRDDAPFIMELPAYHLPQFKSTMIHLWEKAKHFIKKACTIILLSTIVVWVLMHFSMSWQFLSDEEIGSSILASLSSLIQPLFTPLGFGSQLIGVGWAFVTATIVGLIAKENVISVFALMASLIAAFETDSEAVALLIENTGATAPALISFIAFNMLTIPCFASVASARGELGKKEFHKTLIFWLATSYFVSSGIYLIGQFIWPVAIYLPLIVIFFVLLYLRHRHNKKVGEVI